MATNTRTNRNTRNTDTQKRKDEQQLQINRKKKQCLSKNIEKKSQLKYIHKDDAETCFDLRLHRCEWGQKALESANELYLKYHDEEWGVPVHDDIKLFEMLLLEGCQAGLNWSTILNKRENYRDLLDGFDPHIISKYSDAKIESLMSNPRIIRHRGKVAASVVNAKCFLEVSKEFGSFEVTLQHEYYTVNRNTTKKQLKDIPSWTEESKTMSKDLLRRGFKFVGPTICYSLMQAVGMVNDHVTGCFRHSIIKNLMK